MCVCRLGQPRCWEHWRADVEMWINPADVVQERPLAEWNSGGYQVHFYLATPSGGGPGSLYANLRDVNGNDHRLASPGSVVLSNDWQHVAVTYDRGTGGGSVPGWSSRGPEEPRRLHALDTGISISGTACWRRAGMRFVGQMDEMSLYSRALTTFEVQTIYFAGRLGKCSSAPILLASPGPNRHRRRHGPLSP